LTLSLVQTLADPDDDTQPLDRVVVQVDSTADGEAPPPDTLPSAESAVIKVDRPTTR